MHLTCLVKYIRVWLDLVEVQHYVGLENDNFEIRYQLLPSLITREKLVLLDATIQALYCPMKLLSLLNENILMTYTWDSKRSKNIYC